MHDVVQSVQAAEAYLTALIRDARSVVLEEVEPAETEAGWLITLSFLREADGPLAQFSPRRVYKRFHVVGGDVVSMTIRELAGA